MPVEFEYIEYDVWGNAREGFEVNAAYRTGVTVSLPDDASDAQIVSAMKKAGVFKKSVRSASVEIDGDFAGGLYFRHRKTGRPEGELRPLRRTNGLAVRGNRRHSRRSR